jgi:hypothetical protein
VGRLPHSAAEPQPKLHARSGLESRVAALDGSPVWSQRRNPG